MIADADVFRAACLLVDQHGPEAPREALKRADQLAKAGDSDGCAVLRHVAAACRELLNANRRGARLN
jgi:hypothetical protein